MAGLLAGVAGCGAAAALSALAVVNLASVGGRQDARVIDPLTAIEQPGMGAPETRIAARPEAMEPERLPGLPSPPPPEVVPEPPAAGAVDAPADPVPQPEGSTLPAPVEPYARFPVSVKPEDLAPPPAGNFAKHEAPIPAATLALMAAKSMSPAAPVLIRTFKKEAELEVWKKTKAGPYALLKTFPICRWSGQLGPKMREGDRQTPEGFYAIRPAHMNPNSSYYLSFDTGFPNAYDRAQGATGSALMVHGTCSSRGCFAMTDRGIAEIYALVREAFAGGQRAVQFQAYPFRMTAENMVKHRADRHIGFWRQLKEGSDRFEATFDEPAVFVEQGRYAFRPAGDPGKEARASARRAEEEARIAALTDSGRPAVRTTYGDGGQHPAFASLAKRGHSLGEVSRPETLVLAGREVIVTAARSVKAAASARPQP